MAEGECKPKLPVTTSAEAAFWATFGAEAELQSVST